MDPLHLRIKHGFYYTAAAFLCLAYLALSVSNFILAAAFCLGTALVYLFYRVKDLSFVTLLLILPFLGLDLFNQSIAGIPGLRPQLILVPLVLVLLIIQRKACSVPAGLAGFFVIILALFTVAFFRSIEYTSQIYGRYSHFTVYSYFNTQYLSPVFIMLPLLLIPMFYQSDEEIHRIVLVLAGSIALISVCVIGIYLLIEPMKLNFEHFRVTLSSVMGIHGNDLANFCFLAIPFLIVLCLHKKTLWTYGCMFLTLAATALSYSRTAYFIVLLAIVLFYLLSGRVKYLPAIALVIFFILQFAMPESIIDRALTGISEGDLNQISAGRIKYIWLPVLNELGQKPEVLKFGYGVHGITNLRAWSTGTILPVSHVHNMYLDMIMESGVVGLVVLLSFYAYVLIRFGIAFRRERFSVFHKDLLAAAIVAIICYLISGMTGRRLFPSLSNVYVWIIVGLGFSIISAARLKNTHSPYHFTKGG